jgi:glutaredoxin 3
LFQQKGIPTHVIELNQHPKGSLIQQTLTQMTGGHRTVPMVFVKNQFIGGNDDTQAAFANGTIPKLLAAN